MSTPQNISIAACLPVFNRAKTLERALISISEQTAPPEEIIICDFASEDDSRQVIEQWINEYSNILNIQYHKYTFPPTNAEDWNLTIRHAEADFIAILEGDDSWPSTYIEEIKLSVSSNPEIGLLMFPMQSDRGIFPWSISGTIEAKDMKNYIAALQLIAAPSQAVFRRTDPRGKLFLYQDKDYHYAPETELYYRVSCEGYASVIFETPYVYRGIGARKPITPLYYLDIFTFLQIYVKLKKIKKCRAIISASKVFTFHSARIFKRSFEKNRLNKPSDFFKLFGYYIRTFFSILS